MDATPEPKSLQVLIADDEPGIRDLLSVALQERGYKTQCAVDGEDAIQKAEDMHFQIVLCDVNMPKRDGLEVLESIRQKDSDTEVIMMTGHATVEKAVRAMKKGAYDFIQKPFNLDELFILLEKSLEKSELRRTILELRETKEKLERTQIQLIQSEKLAGIGQLAAGVAHELNNPLGAVMGFTQLLLEDKTLNSGHRKDLTTILSQSQRCRVIIQNLLQFSRRKDPKQEVLDIVPVLNITLDLVKYDFSTSGVEIISHIPDKLPLVLGDAHQLQQVFLNLFTNARQAMEGMKHSRLTIEAFPKDGQVVVKVIDTGHGIPESIRNKIFEPFFTTKPTGRGTGLGLSICYGIVEQHHGRLTVDSQVDAGSTFTLSLPIYA